MEDPLLRTLLERCFQRPCDRDPRLLLADRLEEGYLAPLAGPLRQSLLQDEPVLLSGNVRRAHPPLQWAWDGWFGLDASLEWETIGPATALIGAIRMRPWDEQVRMRLKLWRPVRGPVRLGMISGGPLYPHLAEILRWRWVARVSILDLRSTYPGKVGMRALARSGGSLQCSVLDLRSNLLSAAELELLIDWKGFESLECLDLRNNPGDFQDWARRITQRFGKCDTAIRYDQNFSGGQNFPAAEPPTELGR